MEYITKYDSPIGILTISSDGESITGLWIQGQKYDCRTLDDEVCEKPLEVFDKVREWLDSYFKGENPKITVSLSPKGSRFQKEVWGILREIPYGETTTYGQIAKKIAEKEGKESMSAQAVGGAVGRNPISILIPCHRVVGADGSLTGYAGGIERKRMLLEIENSEY